MGLADGLVLRLEGPTGITDQSTAGNDAVANGSIGTSTIDGRAAFHFDSSAKYLTVPYDSELEPDNLTIAMWVRPDSVTPNVQHLFEHPHTSHVDPYTATLLRLEFDDFLAAVVVGSWSISADAERVANTVTAGVWYHLGCTFDGTALRVYVDGVHVATQNNPGVPNYSQQDINIGRAKNVSGRGFLGYLDSIHFYAGVKSDTEMEFLASARGFEQSPMIQLHQQTRRK